MVADDGQVSLGEDEVRALARLVGLDVNTGHLAALRSELESALSAARDLDRVLERTSATGGEPFDPAWPRNGEGSLR